MQISSAQGCVIALPENHRFCMKCIYCFVSLQLAWISACPWLHLTATDRFLLNLQKNHFKLIFLLMVCGTTDSLWRLFSLIFLERVKQWYIRSFFFRKLPAGVKWSIIDRWATHPLLAKTVADRIRTELIEFPSEVKNDVLIMFSAHSLPLKVNTKCSYLYTGCLMNFDVSVGLLWLLVWTSYLWGLLHLCILNFRIC
jgi:hypothetical protein